MIHSQVDHSGYDTFTRTLIVGVCYTCSFPLSFLILAQEKLTLPAKLIHFVMNHFFGAAPVSHPWVVIEGLECFAWAVGFWIGFAILAVSRGAGVATLRVLPGGERAVRPTFLHFHSSLLTIFSIKWKSQSLFRSSAPVREKQMQN